MRRGCILLLGRVVDATAMHPRLMANQSIGQFQSIAAPNTTDWPAAPCDFFLENVIIPLGICLAVHPFFHLPSGSSMESDIGFKAALAEAKKGDEEGGVPIGAALVSADGKVLGRGHNMRLQKGSATLHVSCYGFTATFVISPLQPCA